MDGVFGGWPAAADSDRYRTTNEFDYGRPGSARSPQSARAAPRRRPSTPRAGYRVAAVDEYRKSLGCSTPREAPAPPMPRSVRMGPLSTSAQEGTELPVQGPVSRHLHHAVHSSVPGYTGHVPRQKGSFGASNWGRAAAQSALAQAGHQRYAGDGRRTAAPPPWWHGESLSATPRSLRSRPNTGVQGKADRFFSRELRPGNIAAWALDA